MYSTVSQCKGGSMTEFSIFFHPLQFISTPQFTEILKTSYPSQLLPANNMLKICYFYQNLRFSDESTRYFLLFVYFSLNVHEHLISILMILHYSRVANRQETLINFQDFFLLSRILLGCLGYYFFEKLF